MYIHDGAQTSYLLKINKYNTKVIFWFEHVAPLKIKECYFREIKKNPEIFFQWHPRLFFADQGIDPHHNKRARQKILEFWAEASAKAEGLSGCLRSEFFRKLSSIYFLRKKLAFFIGGGGALEDASAKNAPYETLEFF